VQAAYALDITVNDEDRDPHTKLKFILLRRKREDGQGLQLKGRFEQKSFCLFDWGDQAAFFAKVRW